MVMMCAKFGDNQAKFVGGVVKKNKTFLDNVRGGKSCIDPGNPGGCKLLNQVKL